VAEATVDGRVLLFAVIMSLISGVIFGTVPALESLRQKRWWSQTTLGARRSALRQLFIVTQVESLWFCSPGRCCWFAACATFRPNLWG